MFIFHLYNVMKLNTGQPALFNNFNENSKQQKLFLEFI